MQFQVPQYIDVEDHIVGPLTLKQFFYIASGFLFIFVSFFVVATWLWLITSTIVAAAALSFALVKYNGRPLMTVTLAALRYAFSSHTYIWKKDAPGQEPSSKGFIAKLGLNLATGTKPVAGREKNINSFFGRSLSAQKESEVVRSVTGDRSVAKRVDYR